MKALAIERSSLTPAAVTGAVLARDLRDDTGRVAFAKGHVVGAGDLERLRQLAWETLHVIHPGAGEIHEQAAGARLVRAAAGDGVEAGDWSGGHWPLVSRSRGILSVHGDALIAANRLEGIAVYTAFDGRVVDAGETVGRAKIIPFVIDTEIVSRAEAVARGAGGLVVVRPFVPARIGAVVQESLGGHAAARFRDGFGEKAAWFGCELIPPRFVPAAADAIARAVADVIDDGARVVALAGSRPMDPLDPAFAALRALGARLERQGIPAHPGSLLWLARAGEIPIVGMPSCGLFAQATVFDLVLARLLAGDRVDGEWLATLGHGGLLTRDMAYRFPPYRAMRDRGEVT